MRLPVSTPRRLQAPQVAVLGRVIGDLVLPAAPQNAQPGTPENPDRVGVVEPPVTRGRLDASRPWMVMASRVGKAGDRLTQTLVTGAAKVGRLALARLPRHRRHAGVGRQGLGAGIAAAVIADLSDQPCRGEHRLAVAKQRCEDLPIWM